MKRFINFNNQELSDIVLRGLSFVLDTKPFKDGAYLHVLHFDYNKNTMESTYIFEDLFQYNIRVLTRYGDYL